METDREIKGDFEVVAEGHGDLDTLGDTVGKSTLWLLQGEKEPANPPSETEEGVNTCVIEAVEDNLDPLGVEVRVIDIVTRVDLVNDGGREGVKELDDDANGDLERDNATLGDTDRLGLALSLKDTEEDEEAVESKEGVGMAAEGDKNEVGEIMIL